MYRRDTTDAATEQIANLRIKYYYASCTKITDRSLEILGRMDSLEQVEFYECNGITDAGRPHLAALPRLRGVKFCGSPGNPGRNPSVQFGSAGEVLDVRTALARQSPRRSKRCVQPRDAVTGWRCQFTCDSQSRPGFLLPVPHCYLFSLVN